MSKTMEVDPSSADNEDPSATATLRYQAKKSEREDVQKRTFTKWINMRLARAGRTTITDLVEDVRDGTVLMSLIEVLTGQNLNPEKGKTRVHHLNNVDHSIKFLEKQYNIRLVNICSDDVVNGNTKLILGLIWNLVLHWQIKDVMKVSGGDRPQSNLEKTLLSWCKDCTKGYERVHIVNFTTSFRDGLAFNAIFHHFRPSGFLFEDLFQNDNLTNLRHAFLFAERNFGIEQILDAEDVNVEQPDKKSILIYIMCCYQTFNRLSPLNQRTPLSHSSSSVSSSLSPDSSSHSSHFVVTSPSSPPPFYEAPWQQPLEEEEKMPVIFQSEARTRLSNDQHQQQVTKEVEKFQNSLEEALVWLLEANSNLTSQADISEDVKIVKRQFQDHEDFMIQLTQKQTVVGDLLEWGSEMLKKGNLEQQMEREVDAQMKVLNEKWEELRLDAMGKQTRLQQTLMKLQQLQLDDLEKWLKRMEKRIEESKITLQSGSIHQRVESHKALQEEVESQQQQVSTLQNMVVVVDDVNSDEAYEALEKQLENLGQRWAIVCRWVEESCANLREGVTLWGEYEKRREDFSTWLDSSESRLNEPQMMITAQQGSDFKEIVEQVRQLKMLEVDMDRWMPEFDELYNTSAALEKHIVDDEESINTINQELQSLKDRWDGVVKIMESKSKEIEDSGVELRETGSSTVVISRKRYDGTVETQSVDTSEAPRQKKMKVEEDESSSHQQENKDIPPASMSEEKVAETMKSVDDVLVWACERLKTIPHEPVRSVIELNRRRDLYKNLLDQSSKKEPSVRLLQNDLKSIISTNSPAGLEAEEKKVELDRLWEEFKLNLTAGASQLASAVQAVKEYNVLVKEELRWHEQMNKILNRKPRPSGDAEELAEELDLLENLTSSGNQKNLEQLQELFSLLSSLSHHIQPSTILASPPHVLDELKTKNVQLVSQARERMKYLEEGINSAQSRESRIIDMQQWMTEVSASLQHHLDADLLAGDVPDEHNSLIQEFAEHEEFLISLEKEVETFQKEGKTESADRVAQQIELLKKNFDEVKTKLLRFQKPPDFDAKMGLVKRVLEEINESIQLMEIGGNQIEDIQSQFGHYQKFYKRMSELKPDVEYVVRTGRQVADKKQVEFPNRLNSQIDAIKMQYNRLGSQVTTGKVSLEKCLRLSKKITKEMENMRQLIRRIEDKFPLSSDEPDKVSNLSQKTEELVIIDSLLAEANVKKGILPTLKDAITQWKKISVDGSMKVPEVDSTDIEERLHSAIKLLNEKRSKISVIKETVDGISATKSPVNSTSQHSLSNFSVSPTLLSSIEKFLQKIKSTEVSDVEGLKKLVREEDHFESEINLELKRLAKVKEERKGQGDLEVAEQIGNSVNSLQSSWTACKAELKVRLQQQQHQQQHQQHFESSSPPTTNELLDLLHGDIENLEIWMDELETKLGTDGKRAKVLDEQQLQVLRDQMKLHKTELEGIIHKVRSSNDARLTTEASPLLLRANRRMQKLQSNFPPPLPPPPITAPSPFESADERQTPSSELRVQTPLERQIFFDSNGKPVSTARNEVKRMTRTEEMDVSSIPSVRDDVFDSSFEASPLYRKPSRSSERSSGEQHHGRSSPLSEQVREGIDSSHAAIKPLPHHHQKAWNITMPDDVVVVQKIHHPHHHHQHPLQHQQTDQPQRSPPGGAAAPQNKEKFITGLNNFMSVIMEKAKPQPVTIGSIDEIDEAVQKERAKLQELQAMMPSIKTLISKLELMQQDPDWSQNTKALTKKLCENWDKAMKDIKDRQMELVEMKEDSLKLEAEVKDFEKKIELFKTCKHGNKQQTDSTSLNKQFESINNLSQQIANKYANDDIKQLQLLVDRAASGWQEATGKLMAASDSADDNLELLFNGDLNDLQLWLTSMELMSGNLSEKESTAVDWLERKKLKSAAEELKSQIKLKRSSLKSLSSTANQIIVKSNDPTLKSQVQGHVNEANNRWTLVKEDVEFLISKLADQQQQQPQQQLSKSDEVFGAAVNSNGEDGSSSLSSSSKRNLRKLQEQIMATRSIEDALNNQPLIADDLHDIKGQKVTFQSLLDRINEQRPYVISTLQKEKGTNDDKAKELSKELEKKWIKIQKMSADRSIELDAVIEKMTIIQESLDDLNQHLSRMEAESSNWSNISDVVRTGDVEREIAAVQIFQQKIAPIQGEVDQCNDAAKQMSGAVLSHRVTAALEDVTRRWRNLQSKTEERLVQVQGSRRHGSFSQHILTASVAYPWERAVTSNNVPYYINHSHQSTHWDHPEMTKLVESLSNLDNVRFSAYRTAMKLRHLQKSLRLDFITLDNLSASFTSIPSLKFTKSLPISTHQQLPSSSSPLLAPSRRKPLDESISTNDTTLFGGSYDGCTPTSTLDRSKSFRRGEQVVGVVEAAACLRACFENLHSLNCGGDKEGGEVAAAAEKKNRDVLMMKLKDVSEFNIPLTMDLVLNWLLNVYDSGRNGQMRLSSFKTALVLMCEATLDEKYKYLFEMSSNEETHVDKNRLTRLLKDCLLLPKQLGEAGAFGGTNVEPSVTSCFQKSGEKASLSEKDFLNWLKLEPQSLVWLPVLHRLKSSEEARHHVKCHSCKQLPMRGLRYRCLKCFSFDLCQNCFFSGRTAKSHKLNHPMQEYSSETTSSEDMRDFTKVFKNKFRSKRYFQKHRRLGYLPVTSSMESGDDPEDDDCFSPQQVLDDSTLLQRGQVTVVQRSNSDAFEQNIDRHSDEHSLIAQYCMTLKGSAAELEPKSPLQILKRLNQERKEEIEMMIKNLEQENKNLKMEYEEMLTVKGQPHHKIRNGWSNHSKTLLSRGEGGAADDDGDGDARRLEEKLQALDESNQQLHAELSMLLGQDTDDMRVVARPSPRSTTPGFTTSSSSSSSLPFKRELPSFPPRGGLPHADNGTSREAELDLMLQRLQIDDLPVNAGEANVNNLFREAAQINRAVETLVDIMTEEEGEESDHMRTSNQMRLQRKGGSKT